MEGTSRDSGRTPVPEDGESSGGGVPDRGHSSVEVMRAPAASSAFHTAIAVADAILYEGYLLYPYRVSSEKSRVRWQFGVLSPRSWVDARGEVPEGVAGSAESWWSRTECLLEGSAHTKVDVMLRFLQPRLRASRGASERAGGEIDDAVPREMAISLRPADLVKGPLRVAFESPCQASGSTSPDGLIVRPRGEIAAEAPEGVLVGTLEIAAIPLETPFPLWKLVLRVENRTECLPQVSRPEALRSSLVSTHLLMATEGGSFLSLLEPPVWAADAASSCSNVRTFPVLAGSPGTGDLLLSSPIILYDHPRVAPESYSELFEATEIEELLSLRTLALGEVEKEEVRAGDPLGAALLERLEGMPQEVLGRLHGTLRSLRKVAPDKETAPDDYVFAAGTRVSRGSRVRLQPRARGTDAQDVFLRGRIAIVADVLRDVDGREVLAVGIEDDPRLALGAGPGRLLHFFPEEIEPLGEET